MKVKIPFEGSVSAEIDLEINFRLKDKKFIKCLTGHVNEGNATAGRIYVSHDYIGHNVIILVEEK